MSYETQKQVAAGLSLVSSIGTAVVVGLLNAYDNRTRPSWALLAVTIVSAIAAFISVFASRRLKMKRESRQVFLIYSREDLPAARDIAQLLSSNGFRPWLDVQELEPGQQWRSAIVRALEESAVALVLLSKHFKNSNFMRHELMIALNRLHKRAEEMSPVLPVRLDDSPAPSPISDVQWIDLFAPDGRDRLIASLHKVMANAV